MAFKIFVNGGYWFTHTNTHFPISKIDTNLFTHLFCGGCVSINPQTYELSISNSTKPLIDQFSKAIKEKNHEVKTLLSINESEDDAKGDHGRFAAMARDSSNRATFIRSLISKARESNFDGVDLQWLYPSSREEMANFEALILECYNDFVKEGKECHKPRLILVATVFYLPYIGKDDGVMYPIETMRRTLDWVNVIAYDIFTPISSSNETGPSSALFNNPSKATLGGYFGIRTWIEKGMPTKRMIFGLPFHGWAWKLERSYNHNVFSPAQGPAQGQNISMEGLIEYRNVKKFIVDNNNVTNVLIDHKYPIAYTHCDNTWIAYESEETITAKIAKAKINLAMLGYFASNVAADDDHHSLAKAASREWRKSYGYYWCMGIGIYKKIPRHFIYCSIGLHWVLCTRVRPDLVLFTGDFGEENVELVRSIADLKFAKAAILGNHDAWFTPCFSQEKKDGVQLQLECLGENHIGYRRMDFPQQKLSIVGGRPFSHGGKAMFRKQLLSARYGVKDMKTSAKRIYEAAIGAPEDHLVIILAHNGPTGLGSRADDICGKDWDYGDGDYGDEDLEQAISKLKENGKFHVPPLVVFGHMHKELAYGGHRKMIVVTADNTIYLNGAVVPRVNSYYGEEGKVRGNFTSSGTSCSQSVSRGTKRAFTVVDISDGKVDKITESWISVLGDETSLDEAHLMYQSGISKF